MRSVRVTAYAVSTQCDRSVLDEREQLDYSCVTVTDRGIERTKVDVNTLPALKAGDVASPRTRPLFLPRC